MGKWGDKMEVICVKGIFLLFFSFWAVIVICRIFYCMYKFLDPLL